MRRTAGKRAANAASGSGDRRRLPAVYVKPFNKGQENDYNDGEAIAEAALRPNLPDFCTGVSLEGSWQPSGSLKTYEHRYTPDRGSS